MTRVRGDSFAKLGLHFQSRHFLHPDVEDDERDRMRFYRA